MQGKIIVLSAPSGSGKSTIIKQIIDDEALRLGFSVSATSRKPRGQEQHGKDYYFITDEEFLRRIDAGDFVEWEEVYAGTHYGTLASEVERVTGSGRNLIMDIDVKGGVNVKKRYADRALAIFIMPPSLETLSERLHSRATDSEEVIQRRLAKAEYEISFAPHYDMVVVNDDLATAVEQVRKAILRFISE
ncbi:MAG: guanylate kinase [Muribaculaceae bacterium]|nr:guanylate kinase [Bacteroidales bacterium]MDE6243690.1 guanylate kinase [Muribaculaceae bacterium]